VDGPQRRVAAVPRVFRAAISPEPEPVILGTSLTPTCLEEAAVLWRLRTTMADRPGSLASLARRCGEQGVNILGLQIFPGVQGVTDEVVLRAPDSWRAGEVAELVTAAGGSEVTVDPCTEHALVDGPIQYLHALRRVAADPASLVDMLARLLDAEPVPGPRVTEALDTMTVEVGARQVVLRRTAPFTATEHARAIAFAEVAAELLADDPADGYAGVSGPDPSSSAQPVVRLAGFEDAPALMRMHQRCSTDSIYRRYAAPLTRIDDRFARRLLIGGGGALVATVGAEVVGVVSVSGVEDAVAEVALLVEDGWQRRGLGTRLLSAAARLARGHGADEVVLRSRTHNPALMSLAFASGLRARIKLEGDSVVVTVGVEGLKPLAPVPAAQDRTAPA
jgi:GNAT superfamily N-acetyltransferase